MKKTLQKGDKEGEDEINNEFIITIMTDADNVSGLQEQEKFVESIVNRFDVRICVMMNTWLEGVEKQEAGRSHRSLHSIDNRSNKTNRGGVTVVMEPSLTEDTVNKFRCLILQKV